MPIILAAKSVDAHVTYFDNGWRINYCFAVHILCVVFVHLSNQTSLVKKMYQKVSLWPPFDHFYCLDKSNAKLSQERGRGGMERG